jgi:very-short-patch-repair endonuclease
LPVDLPVDLAIARIAGRGHGNVTRGLLLSLGLDANAITYRVRIGRLYRVHRGVYAVGRPPHVPLERAAAAVLACGPGAALSDESALTLWGFAREWPDIPQVTIPADRDRRPAGIDVHRRAGLTRADLRITFGIRATSPARTLLDCAARRSRAGTLTRLVNDALHTPYVTRGQLTDVAARNPGHRGARRLSPFVEQSDGATRSALEDRFLAFCERFGLPRPRVNTQVAGYEADAHFPAHRLVVELDGWEFHNDRTAFESDRDRDADRLAAGLTTVRLTWDRLTAQPAAEAARLRLILDRNQGVLDSAAPPS